MKKNRTFLLLVFLCLLGSSIALVFATENNQSVASPCQLKTNNYAQLVNQEYSAKQSQILKIDEVKPIPEYLGKSIKWLVDAQHEDGSWGAGAHRFQNVKNPKKVSGDPATTSFAAMALLRTGSTPKKGTYAKNVSKALNFVLLAVEASPKNATNITQITGTQPQVKLGQNIDLSMALKFLTRSKTFYNDGTKTDKRISTAMDRCIAMLEGNQSSDGSWNDQAWAPVLQSAMANAALEEVVVTGYGQVDEKKLKKSRAYQKSNVNIDGKAETAKAAGIELYAVASTQRATALESVEVAKRLKKRKQKNRSKKEISKILKDDGYEAEEAEALAEAYVINKAASKRLADDVILKGFGNNGGEEFLSFMMTSESMVESGDEAWTNWHKKMDKMLSKVQNGDGSWSGHHCITSPVFCTTAVIMTLTADRDQAVLQAEKKS